VTRDRREGVREIDEATIAPGPRAVLRAMGVPEDRETSAQVEALLSRSLDVLIELSEPRSVTKDVARDEFARIYEGAGNNASPAPLEQIIPRSERLTLFVVTLGADVSVRIRSLFDEGEPALATALDAAASEATELAATHLERLIESESLRDGCVSPSARALRYSPGYCGWNLSGQRALFASLGPERVGVRLLESCLMEPLKSISGVVVTGPVEIHRFEPHYAFCSECRTKDCRERISALMKDYPS